jgi:hypothetical protein
MTAPTHRIVNLMDALRSSLSAKKKETLDFVIDALRNGGYTVETNEIISADYAGVTKNGDIIYNINTLDYDDAGEAGLGQVYVRFVDGEWQGDF